MRSPLTVLATLLVLAAAAPASAHHILGLPHYKYGDDYPQIPYVEVLATVESKELVFTYFPGTPKPGERVRFKLYIRDTATGEPFREPLQASFVQKSFFGADHPIGEPLSLEVGTGPEGNDYKFFRTFEAAEAYEMRLRFPNRDAVEVIPFPVSIGVTDDRPLIFGALALLVLAVLTVAVLKRRARVPPPSPGRAPRGATRSATEHPEAA